MFSIEYLRSFRIIEYSIFDFAAAFLGIALAAPLLSKIFLQFGIVIPKRNWVIATLPISLLVHLLFGRITLMTKNIFDVHDHYLLKLVVIVCAVASLYGIKKVKK